MSDRGIDQVKLSCVCLRGPKVTYSDPRMSYIYPKVTYNVLKVTFIVTLRCKDNRIGHENLTLKFSLNYV